MEPFVLKDRTALITGGTRGIGRALAEQFARAGARVIVHGHAMSEPAQACLTALGERGEFVSGDFTDPAAPDAIVAELVRRQLTIDILVLNAATDMRTPFFDVQAEEFNRQVTINFQTNFRLIQLLASGMLERGWGRILGIGSVQEFVPHPAMTAYAAMKAAQRNLVENLARQFGPRGVTVNNLAPGVIITDRNREVLKDETYAARIRAKIPVGFFGEGADCAGAALLLCSEAGRYINGITLPVDGGMHLP